MVWVGAEGGIGGLGRLDIFPPTKNHLLYSGIQELVESELVEMQTCQTNEQIDRGSGVGGPDPKATNELVKPNLTLGQGPAGLRLG